MISKIQSYNSNVYQPKFTSKVRFSPLLANILDENDSKAVKRQIRTLEKNGNDDLVYIEKEDGWGRMRLTVYKKNKNKIMQNNLVSYTSYMIWNKKGYGIVDLYNEVINEIKQPFQETGISKVLFKNL